MVLILHLERVDHLVHQQGSGVNAAGVLAPLQLQALRAGRRALQWGRSWWEATRPGQHGGAQGAGADGVDRLNLYAVRRNEKTC